MAKGDDQLALFAVTAPEVEPFVSDEDARVAERLPRQVRLGTSSWSFPGWAGIVYAGAPTTEQLAERGLEAYAQHPLLRAVSLDRAYYAPVPGGDLARYADQVERAAIRSPRTAPFRILSKVWDELTTAVFPAHARYGARAGEANPFFLDAARFAEHVLGAAESLRGHEGPYIVELTPMPHGALSTRDLCAKVERFARDVGPRARLAFELRNQEHLTPRWFDTLSAVSASHVFTYWTAMPSLRAQLTASGGKLGSSVVARLMLPPFTRYEEKKATFAPFDKLAAPQDEMRDDVLRLVLEALDRGADDVYVLVNNKAEGSAPLTVRELAKAIAREA